MIGQILKSPPLFILLVNTYLVAANQNDVHSHSIASADFQAVNSYLTEIYPLDMERAKVVEHLLEAVEKIESVGVEILGALSDDSNAIEPKFKPLMDGNLAVVLNILKNLIRAADCDEESKNFLLLTSNETFEGQFLNNYAKLMSQFCLERQLAKAVKSFEKSAEKVMIVTFELLEDLANKLAEDKKIQQPRDRSSITINDKTTPNYSFEETLSAIKKLSFDINLRPVALKLNQIFNSRLFTNDEGLMIKLDKSIQLDKMDRFYQDYLVSPCLSLAQKLRTTLSPFANYQSKKLVVSPELKSIQEADTKLEYLLEISRMCLEVEANEDSLWNMLKNMR